MSNWLTNFLHATETDVINLIADIKNDMTVAITDINKALNWIGSQAPAIAANLTEVTKLVTAVGGTSNPEIAAAVVAANAAVVALNAFANAKTAGQNNAEAVVQGYVAVKQAAAAVASASAAAAASTPANG